MDTYLSIHCTLPAELEDELPELLAPWPILGTEIEQLSDAAVRIAVYLRDTDEEGTRGLRQVLTDAGAAEITQSALEGADWLAAYRASLQPFAVGQRWWIDPHPDRPTRAPTGRQRLAIEPRMAFGTGTHESTRAILIALEEMDVSGRRVLDVGTGSGILAIAAECLGASSVVGLDIDDTAIWVAIDTARQQDWESRVSFVIGPVGCLGEVEFDIVLCNMIAANFLPLAVELREFLKPTGVVVFSGMLTSDVKMVSESLESAGLEVLSKSKLGDWASLSAARAAAR